jgi:hypothetical protein
MTMCGAAAPHHSRQPVPDGRKGKGDETRERPPPVPFRRHATIHLVGEVAGALE